MMNYISLYFKKLEPKAILFVGFLLSYPIVLVATNSIPTILPIETLFFISLIVWLILYLIKPIKSVIAQVLLVVQYLWFFSLAAVLPQYLQDGVNTIMPGGVKVASFIYEHLFGETYAHFIYYIRQFLTVQVEMFNGFYYYTFIVLITAAIMIVVMKLIEKRVNWKVFVVVSLYFVIAWFIYVSKLKGYFSLYFVGLTVYRQFIIYENLVIQARGMGERTRYYNYTSAIVIGTIVMVFILITSNVFMYFIPMDRINDKLHTYVPVNDNIRSNFRSLTNSKIFSFNSTMYAPNDNLLGGPIIDRDYSVVMRVKADQGGMYLRGRVKNVYDGSQWLTDFEIFHNNIDYDVEIPEDHLEELFLYPETIATRTIFSPYKYYNSSFKKDIIYGNEDSVVYRKSNRNINLERYSIKHIKPEFVYLYDELPDEIRENYLEVPSQGLTQTRGLTTRITVGIDDPYEKMKTIERYLRDNYRYTLNTREIDESDDFVESFLFDEAQGYCTYFASSLAVMGRMVDVPTRYVEGFITSDLLDYEGFYEISANRAHAWVEAYIEGQGWVRFEATPAYQNGDEIESTETFTDALESENDISGITDEERFLERDDDIFNVEDDYNKISATDVLMILLYLALVIGLILLIISKVKRLRHDVHHGDETEKIKNRIIYILSMCLLVDEDVDTSILPKAVIMKNTDLLELEIGADIIQIIDESLYSNKTFTQEEFELFDAYFRSFEKQVRKKVTSIAHFLNKVILNSLYHKDYYL